MQKARKRWMRTFAIDFFVGCFKCTKMKSGADQGRIYIRGVHLLVQSGADFNNVFLKCYLVPEGQKQFSTCTFTALEPDVANRLGNQLGCGSNNCFVFK